MKKTQKQLQIKELITELKAKSCDYIEYLCDYDSVSIDSAFNEIADNNVSIYSVDIINYLKDHVDEVNGVIDCYGWNGVDRDIHKAAQYAEYDSILSKLYNNIDNAIELYALNILQNNGVNEITTEQYKELKEELKAIDSGSYVSDIEDIIMKA